MLTVGSLFAGIGGFDLGFERAGMRTIWQVEQDAFCRAVLARHFPDAERFDDVCTVGAHNLAPVDLLCGGFPCQDISLAGKGAGIDGARSGLWAEYARIIGELGPRWVVVENVASLTSRGLDRITRDLSALGYDAEWDCLPASAFGAPHRRDRLWLVAYPGGLDGGPGGSGRPSPSRERQPVPVGALQVADTDGAGRQERRRPEPVRAQQPPPECGGEALADPEGVAERPGLRESKSGGQRGGRPGDGGGPGDVADAAGSGGQTCGAQRASQTGADEGTGRSCGQWSVEPDVGRVADGVPARVDRLSALGNALVPQIAEWIGRRILDYEEGPDE